MYVCVCNNIRSTMLNLKICLCLTLLSLFQQHTQTQAAHDGSLKVVYAVNSGSSQEHTDKNGIHYEADPLQVGTASDYGNHLLIIGRVSEQDEILYRTERYHTASFGYDLPIDGDGEYALILKFCEVYFNNPNRKVFDVVLNKKHTIVSELDIFHQVGRGTAHEEYAFFTISRGRLYYKDEVSDVRGNNIRLDFIKGHLDNPKINAFALLKGDVERIPRLSPISDDILPMDADMAVFHDRISADSSSTGQHIPVPPPSPAATPSVRKTQQQAQKSPSSAASQLVGDDELDEDLIDDNTPMDVSMKTRKTSGPRHPNPYTMDDSSVMLPVFIAIGAFIPLLFCLCKL